MIIDMNSLEPVYEKYKDNIFAIGFNYFKNSIEADDVVQETFFFTQDERLTLLHSLTATRMSQFRRCSSFSKSLPQRASLKKVSCTTSSASMEFLK